MAKITGTFTGWKGKVGNMVFAMWKGIQVAKTKVTPYNPQSSGQTIQRTKFMKIVQIGKYILADIIRPFWDPFAGQKSSGWAEFLKANLLAQTGSTIDYELFSFAQGSLYPTPILSASYSGIEGECTINFSPTTVNNQTADDKVVAVVMDSGTGKLYYDTSNSIKRSDESIIVTIEKNLNASDLIAYLFFYRTDGDTLIVSNSQMFHL